MHCSVLVALLLPSPWIMTPANGLVAPLLRPIGMYPLAPLSPFRISLNYTFSGGDSAKTASSIQDEYDDSIILFARGDGNGPKTASPTSAITITEPTGKSSTSATTSVQSSVFSSLPTSSSTQPSVSKNKSTSSSKSKKRVTHRATSTTDPAAISNEFKLEVAWDSHA
ncbi:hypothetical protein DFJ73DRAFT_783038 [Zopfochytrium polystomum]|nr:hypothetical protein DFJ73DRAFT_786966 [Zopfochytrium polystomum]KAI9327198.1 hypothetical protein DFJ73DRAFT_783038 [Zopfochytrium polystomum]